MRKNTEDKTLQRNYLLKFRFLVKDYELVKAKEHSQFKRVKDFFAYNQTCAQTFLKYYHRFKQSGNELDLLPQKRGPRYRTRRPLPFIEQKVKELRERGNSRYEIVSILRPSLQKHTPSASGVYNILCRLNLNRLTKPMKKTKQQIIKERAGELAHVDCHTMAMHTCSDHPHHLYVVCVIDDYSRIAWAEVVEDIKSLTVMFATLRCLNMISQEYHIKFEELLTDNGPEFGVKTSTVKQSHPFERMLMELSIKHRYTRPYRPQTNGKVERFWRTLEDDMLRDTSYPTVQELKDELVNYLVYYNNHRPHQSLVGRSPLEFLQSKSSSN